MYSQHDLDDAVAAGAITAEAADALRALHRAASARPPFRRRRAVPAASPASTTSSCRSPPRSCCSRSAGSASRSARRIGPDRSTWRRPVASLAPARGRRDRLGPGAVLHRQAAHGAALDPAAARLRRRRVRDRRRSRWCSAIGADQFDNNHAARRRSSAPLPRAVAAGAAWLHWRRFRVPITVAAGAAAVAGDRRRPARRRARRRSPSSAQQPHPRLRPAARHRHVPVRHVVGLRRTARGSPAARTSPSGFTCWRRR